MIGKTIGHFQILEPIGAGGMGEVYLARDTQLNREVALKLLPPAFAADPERLARFRREAETLAAFSDPRIGQIYGLETSTEQHALVLELIPGPTLADRIADGPLPERQALDLAIQIAGALDAAHRRGIVHRDLKPANIKLPPGGGAKVLDFGLAKAFANDRDQPDVANSPTLTMQATQAGIIIGTAAYMAPEQAKGGDVDKRADIWAFGCVLYEMLTGRRAFKGADVSEILASVLAREPEWEALPYGPGSRLHSLLSRCLTKDPEQRFRDIGDVALALEEIRDLPEPVADTAAATRPTRAIAITAVATTIACLALFAGWTSFQEPPPAPQSARFPVGYPNGMGPLLEALQLSQLAISPDGGTLAFIAQGELWIRELDELTPRRIDAAGEWSIAPVFSPDGEWVAYMSVDTAALRKIRVNGTAGITVVSDVDFGFLLSSWTDRDTLLFGGRQVVEVPAGGGPPVILVEAEPDLFTADPQRLPGGNTLLFVRGNESQDGSWSGELLARDLATGETRVLAQGVQAARYSPSGHLLLVQGGALSALRFDADRVETSGSPVPLVEGVLRRTDRAGAQLAISAGGTLAYLPADRRPSHRLVWVDARGNQAPLEIEPGNYGQPRLSPDGTRLAVQKDNDIWVHDLARTTTTRVSFDGGSRPVWTVDGRWVIFTDEGGLSRVRADGSAPPERLTEGPHHSNAATPDGRHLVFHSHETGSADIALLDLETGEIESWLATPDSDDGPTVSPDGRWIAFASDASGQLEIYAAPLFGERTRTQISVGGGDQPLWVGDRIYYRRDNEIVSVTVRTAPAFEAARPETVFPFRSPFSRVGPFANYDYSTERERFVMVAGDSEQISIVVAVNWFEELRRLLPE